MNTSPTHPAWLSHIRPDVQAMQAYAVQDSKGMVKLDAMENPFSLPVPLQLELGQRLGAVALNRYPGERVNHLRHALAQHAQMPEGFDIMLGNGSDELISLISLACAMPGASFLAPVPGFVMYAMSAQLMGLQFHGVPLAANFELDEAAMLQAIEQHRPAVVYLAYPNNPTGTLWNAEVIERIVKAQGQLGGLVVMDEAYQPFASQSYMDRLAMHPHVLLMRTLSKFGLAGVRLGYMVGPKALIAQIDKVRPPYNISNLNCECALFALEHAAVFDQQAHQIRQEREKLVLAMSALPGVEVFPSQANMLLVRMPDATKCFEGMKSKGILVKNVSKMHVLLANCLRLTVGTPDENALMLAAFKESL
jgi:histidinol-phosphate aminotransferase